MGELALAAIQTFSSHNTFDGADSYLGLSLLNIGFINIYSDGLPVADDMVMYYCDWEVKAY